MSALDRRFVLCLSIAAILAMSAAASVEARRLIGMRGSWEGEITDDESVYTLFIEIEKQARRSGRLRGRADVFEQEGSLSGQIRRNRKVFAVAHTRFRGEPITLRLDLVVSPDGKTLIGTAFARSRLHENFEGVVTLGRR